MLELSAIDLDPIASALADQTDFESSWLVDPANCETIFWSTYGGFDGKTPVDLDQVDLIAIHPLPSRVWYERRTEPMAIESLPVHETAEEWQADR